MSVILEQYKIYLQLTDQISARRQTANSFFLSVNTAIVALLGYIDLKNAPVHPNVLYALISIAGVMLCLLWYRIIRSYRDLNTARFTVIHLIETLLPLRPYTAEWDCVGRGAVSKLYKPFTHIELYVPWLFLMLFAAAFVWIVGS